jgi:hypothetical protein
VRDQDKPEGDLQEQAQSPVRDQDKSEGDLQEQAQSRGSNLDELEGDLQEQALSPPRPPTGLINQVAPIGTVETRSRAEVSTTASDPGQIEVDLLVHAEAEDLSVFSSEAAEADQLRALGSTGSRKGSSKHNSKSSASLGGVAHRGSQSSRGGSPAGGSSSSCRSPPTQPLPSSGTIATRESKRIREERVEVS